MEASSDIADFSRRDITLLGKTKPVLLTGATGPAVIVIHEFTPTLARFCRWCAMPGSECTRRSCSARRMLATPRSQRWGVFYRSVCRASSRCLQQTNPAR